MTEPTPRAPDLEAGLAEIDRRLRQIQDELAGIEPPGVEPAGVEPAGVEPAGVEPAGVEPAGVEPATEVSQERSAPRRRGRSGPLAAVLQRSSHSARTPTAESGTEIGEQSEDAAAIEAARQQLADLQRQLDALADLRDKLLASIRELIDGYQAVAHAQPGAPGRPREAVQPSPSAEVTLSVGPFATLDAVRAFERAVADLPGVRETSLRGYEGEDRAIVDVRLESARRSNPPGGPTS